MLPDDMVKYKYNNNTPNIIIAPQQDQGVENGEDQAKDRLTPLPQGLPAVRQRTAQRRENARTLKWMTEMNMEIMRTFYIINHCRDDPLPGWEHALHAEFTRRNPPLNVTEQNIVDRKNVILRKSYLFDLELQQIKREIKQQLYPEEEQQISEEPDNKEEGEPGRIMAPASPQLEGPAQEVGHNSGLSRNKDS